MEAWSRPFFFMGDGSPVAVAPAGSGAAAGVLTVRLGEDGSLVAAFFSVSSGAVFCF